MISRVLVGCPTNRVHAHCIDRFCEGLKRLTYASREVVFFDDSNDKAFADRIRAHGFNVIERAPANVPIPQRISDNKNAVIDYALSKKFDFVLLLDTDVLVPADLIERMLNHDKPIVTGLYLTILQIGGKPQILPLIFDFTHDPELLKPVPINAVMGDKLMRVKGCGLGCCLAKSEVFLKARPRIEDQSSEDLPFCKDAQLAGYEIWADTSIKTVHMKPEKDFDWPAAVFSFSHDA
jgi:glycosyltransferase involved in cell wall biosynthesis